MCCLFYCSESNFNKSFHLADRVHEIFYQTIAVNQCRTVVNKYYDKPGYLYSSNYCQLQQHLAQLQLADKGLQIRISVELFYKIEKNSIFK